MTSFKYFRYCCVPGCLVRAEDGMCMQQFPNPAKDFERFRSWVQQIGGEIVGLDNLYVYNNRRVCRKHFEEKWLYPRGRLCSIAIPTLHLQAANEMVHTETSTQSSTNDTKNVEKSKEKGTQRKKRTKTNAIPRKKSTQPEKSNRAIERTPKSAKAKRQSEKAAAERPGVPRCTQCGVDIDARELYRCVQCPLVVMCAKCGRENAHAQHCVLRVPSLLVYNKMHGIFGTLRKLIKKTLSKDETCGDEKCDDSEDDMALAKLATSKHQDGAGDTESHKSIKQEKFSSDEEDKSPVSTAALQYEISIEPTIPVAPSNKTVNTELKAEKRKATQTPEKTKIKKYRDSGAIEESGTAAPIEIKKEVEESIEIKVEKLDDDEWRDPQQSNIYEPNHGTIIDYSNR